MAQSTDAQTRPGTKTWSVLSEEERKAAARLGFGETEWDDLRPTTGGTRLVRSLLPLTAYSQSHGMCSICACTVPDVCARTMDALLLALKHCDQFALVRSVLLACMIALSCSTGAAVGLASRGPSARHDRREQGGGAGRRDSRRRPGPGDSRRCDVHGVLHPRRCDDFPQHATLLPAENSPPKRHTNSQCWPRLLR